MTIVNVFVLCYNESILLPHTIKHYKTFLPSCKITILDNESTDNSVEIAKLYGCDVLSWSSENIINDHKYKFLKNNAWKFLKEGWVLVIDMDEWVCVTEDELIYEKSKGTTILKIQGLEMVGESNKTDLSDINLHNLKKHIENDEESKHLCFLREKINDMNYGMGAHFSFPRGIIKYSDKTYYNKHMSNLGLPFLLNKMQKRFERSEQMRKLGFATHYTNDEEKVKTIYKNMLDQCKEL